MIEAVLYGFLSGLAATAVMSLPQLLFWRRWGTPGILEWHENQMIVSRLTGRRPEDSLVAGFIFHFANGGIAAAVYAPVVVLLPQLYRLGPAVLGPAFGIILWVLTLAPIHKPLTGLSITRHPLGWRPAILSIALHIVYGIVVALLVDFLL
ncbi:MAG: hypothetical protein RMJ28_07370 [Nitrososphaerota archaeon]|nr:hypothetical protein [Candidatus Calditenuaceae archaeon]MDW8074032.1 hypothetical protein [Nitrososphaerota archaeon]